MSTQALRRALLAYLLLLIPLACLSARYDPYAIDGDAVAYMDLADLIHAHRWAAVVNGYWHPLYPALLCLAQILFRPARATELHAYYVMNLLLFFVQVCAMLIFTWSLVRWRAHVQPRVEPLLPALTLQLLGVTLQTTFLMRELSIGKVRPDGLLETSLLLALALLMESLTAATFLQGLSFASLMGMFFGFAYLTKSIALPLAMAATAVLFLFSWHRTRRNLARATALGAASLTVFAGLTGPYIVALSHQMHRFDTGDSGALNYAWCVSGTEKLHLQPRMADRYGSAAVHLIHPERELIERPGVYSYRALPNGTYAPWFDPAYFNERITPVFSLGRQLRRGRQNVISIARYLVDHPEPLILIAILLVSGARMRWNWRVAGPCFCLGTLLWLLYGLVAVEGRYVSIAYAVMLLPVFASFGEGVSSQRDGGTLRRTAAMLVVLLALAVLANLLRVDAENRRNEIVRDAVPVWRDHEIYGAAEALTRLGVVPGDAIACIGGRACLYDHYWARLAGTRILTEVFVPDNQHLTDVLDAMANRQEVIGRVQGEGARVLVGNFDPGAMNSSHVAARGWVRLGETRFYALPLNGFSAGGAVH